MNYDPSRAAETGPKKRRVAAAQYIVDRHGIPCSPKTLAKLACVGGGPAFYKAGRIPLYADADLDAWAASRLSRRVTSTSELAA
ncbi:hypothetical protein BHAOGJBA_4300 [Methylobacterium hispanicum]|uniref:Transcriptional regulator n=1 Tax=Methylobacterium hispanicum TaxID=270350 RepID=A0AAV4ZR72_9HYPH|nr:hypothetical protein [Methylobacterium hispanicum]GJD90758.1 hypothetical protein BHAOGJBA_4300 [Methylobacterium hispanicum]